MADAVGVAVDGSAVDDAGAADGAGSEADTVRPGLEGAGLDGVAEGEADVVEGAGFVGVVDLTGVGVGEVFPGRGEDTDGEGDGVAGALVCDGREVRDGVGDGEGGRV